MRRRLPPPDGMVRPPLVVVVDDGMFAMTADRMSVGDTPSVVAEVQPARESTETAAIAPARACEGVTMSRGKASSKPRCSEPRNALIRVVLLKLRALYVRFERPD